MRRKKVTKEERMQKIANNLAGTGLYIYENNTSGFLNLPKKSSDGIKVVPPKVRFKGDSYFMLLVKPPQNLLRFIQEIKTEEIEPMSEKKLILDQPDMVTARGTVEHVVDDISPLKNLRDSVDNKQQKDILLNENPMDGIEIIIA